MSRLRHVVVSCSVALGLLAIFLLAATSLALEGYSHYTGMRGVASRWISADMGETIPYIIDMEALPTGITSNQATVAVSNAFQAWSEATGLSFCFDSYQTLGTSSPSILTNDNRFRVQLHNLYNYPIGLYEAAFGGPTWEFHWPSVFPNGGEGGRLGTNEFDHTVGGYIVLDHLNALLQNTQTLAAVVCHEIGHGLGFAHSSDDESETNAVLVDAMMYCVSHNDNRGARLGTWDFQNAQKGYPTNNTPPYGYDRVMDIMSSPPPQPAPTTGVNQVEVGYDRQQTQLSLIITNAVSSSGVFFLSDNHLCYTTKVWSSGPRLDPGGGSTYGYCFVRISDSTNLSPPLLMRVLSLNSDTNHDGIPDNWFPQYGVTNATDDPDKDGFCNLFEWINGSNPTNSASCLSITSFDGASLTWQAKGYELYEIHSTTNLSVPFTRCMNPLTPHTSVGTAVVDTASSDTRYFRVYKVP